MATKTENSRFYYRRPAGTPTPAKTKSLVTGPANLWTTLQTVKDAASGATKTTRAMEVPGGVIVNTCTRGANYAAEALVLVPGAKVMREANGTGRLVLGA